MRDDEQVDRPDGVGRAHQLELLVDRQVAEMQRPERAEAQVDADRLRVVAQVLRCPLEVGAVGVGLAGAGKRLVDHLACGGHDLHVDPGQGHGIARRDHGPAGGAVEFPIGALVEVPHRLVARLDRRPVVHVVPDRDARRQFREPAVVVAVPVGGEQVVDPLEAGRLCRGQDAADVALGRRTAVPGVDEQRLAGGADEERGAAALHIHEVDAQGVVAGRGPSLDRGVDHGEQQREQGADRCSHGTSRASPSVARFEPAAAPAGGASPLREAGGAADIRSWRVLGSAPGDREIALGRDEAPRPRADTHYPSAFSNRTRSRLQARSACASL